MKLFLCIVNTIPALKRLIVIIVASVSSAIPAPPEVNFPASYCSLVYTYIHFYIAYGALIISLASRFTICFKSVSLILMILEECLMPNWYSVILYEVWVTHRDIRPRVQESPSLLIFISIT